MKKLALPLGAAILLTPSIGLLSVGVLFNTVDVAIACVPSNSLVVGPIPDTMTAPTRGGQTVTLDRQQLTHAASIISVGGNTEGVGRPGVIIALMAALTESNLRMLANSSAYPESASYPNDGNGSDHDSLGLFQLRPAAGWGTVAEVMDPSYQARAFLGGQTGPNYPSPRGLLDIPDWQQINPGAVAQAVEGSAYPDRYENYQPVAEAIVAALTKSASTGGGSGAALSVAPETSGVVFPLPTGTWVRTDGYGGRVHPITSEWTLHTGTDFAAADGTPIFAIADGVVAYAGHLGTYGRLIVIEHTVGGQLVASAYAHMLEHGVLVSEGDRVVAGQHIADVGSSGYSTGPHLHFEIRPGGSSSPAIDAGPWLASHGAQSSEAASRPQSRCESGKSFSSLAGTGPAPAASPSRLGDESNGRVP